MELPPLDWQIKEEQLESIQNGSNLIQFPANEYVSWACSFELSKCHVITPVAPIKSSYIVGSGMETFLLKYIALGELMLFKWLNL